jgi:hypothetical protein
MQDIIILSVFAQPVEIGEDVRSSRPIIDEHEDGSGLVLAREELVEVKPKKVTHCLSLLLGFKLIHHPLGLAGAQQLQLWANPRLLFFWSDDKVFQQA